MSQTSNVAPEGNGVIQPLVIYNCVHHREENPIDCAADATAALAAQIYNAALIQQSQIPKPQIENFHPLNFMSAGSGSMSGMLKGEVDALANIARGSAEATEVLLSNYQILLDSLLARADDANADLVATLGTLDATIRAQFAATTVMHRG